MHKGIIMLTKATNREEAIDKVEEFLECYQNDVWDWYVIGGRWTGTLSKYDPYKDPTNLEECWLCSGTGSRNDKLGNEAREKDPKYTCNGCNGEGKSVKFNLNKHDGDSLPLTSCIDIVREWWFDPIEQGKKKEQEAKDRWLKEGKENWGMYGYSLKISGNMFQQNFCFDCNVFNIDSYDYSIPEDINLYYAVMIDIHN